MTKGQWFLILASLLVVVLSTASMNLPGPWWWLMPSTLLLAYQGIIVWGVLDLNLGMFAKSTCQISTEKKLLALTFDDGPDPVSTPLVLEALARADAKATFFVIGRKVELYPEIIRKIEEAGHQLAIHSYGHELNYSFLSPSFVQADIARCKELIENCGVRCSDIFRPPVGQASPRTAKGMALAGVHCVGWSVRGGDGVTRRKMADCLTRLRAGIAPGAIVLLHDAWQGRSLKNEVSDEPSADAVLARCPAGVQALPELLRELSDRGFRSVTLNQLFEQTS